MSAQRDNHTPERRPAEPAILPISTRSSLLADETELGVVFASTKGVEPESFHTCVDELIAQAQAKGADRLIALQLVQSQYQWNARTSVVATAVRVAG